MLFVGVGNHLDCDKPKNTRCNAGYIVIDKIVSRRRPYNQSVTGTLSHVHEKDFPERQVFLKNTRPDEDVGIDVLYALFKSSTPLSQLCIVYPDPEMRLGSLMFRRGISGKAMGGGIENIKHWLGRHTYLECAIGIDKPSGNVDIEEYLSSEFPENHLNILNLAVDKFLESDYHKLLKSVYENEDHISFVSGLNSAEVSELA